MARGASAGEYLPPLITELKADTSGLEAGFKQAKKLQDEWKKSQEGVNRELAETGVQADKTKAKVSDYSRAVSSQAKENENAVATVRREWERLHKLQEELRKKARKGSGDQSSLLGELGDIKGDIDRLRKLGQSMGINLIEGMGGAVSAGGPYLQAALWASVGTLIAVTAPLVGGAIGGALLVGLGGAVIGVGAMILKDDKKIIAGFEKLADRTSKTFTKAAEPLKKPFLKAMDFIGKEFVKLEPQLTKLFAAAAPLIAPLAEGFMTGLSLMLPGLVTALENSGPLFQTLKDTLPGLMESVGSFFMLLSEHAPALSLALGSFIKFAALAIYFSGLFIVALAEVNKWGVESVQGIMSWASKTWGKFTEWAGMVGTWAKTALKNVGNWLVDGLWGGITDKWGSFTQKVEDLFSGIADAAKRIFKTGSPSRVFMGIGRDVVDGFAIGVERSGPRAAAAWAGIAGGAGAYAVGATRGTGWNPAYATGGAAPVDLKRGGPQVIQAHLYIDSRRVHTQLVPVSQRYNMRNGTTGLDGRTVAG